MSKEASALPTVSPHPELINAFTRVADEATDCEGVFEQLKAFVHRYLPVGASEGHGELIGELLFVALRDMQPKTLRPADTAIWRALPLQAEEAKADARGVLLLTVLIGMLSETERGREGAKRLYQSHLTKIFPPSPARDSNSFSVLEAFDRMSNG